MFNLLQRIYRVTLSYYNITWRANKIVFRLVNWHGPTKNIWSKQCPYHGHGTKTPENVDDCKKSCLRKVGCNAINYKSKNGDCVFRKCPENVPIPTHNQHPEYKGYYITKGTITKYV